jgi:predicted NAD/FAD-dependent oxidoreductase
LPEEKRRKADTEAKFSLFQKGDGHSGRTTDMQTRESKFDHGPKTLE